MLGFERVRSYLSGDKYINTLNTLIGELDDKWKERLERIAQAWDFYEGYHWEGLPAQDTPELTINYSRAFVNKFVAFELGKAFTFTTHSDMEEYKVTSDGRTLFEFLEDVWEDNDQYAYCIEMGQSKSITGEAWTHIDFQPASEVYDPFGEYPDGRVVLRLMPTNTIFPEYDPKDPKRLVKLTIMYVYRKVITNDLTGKERTEEALFRQIWTDDKIITYDGKEEPKETKNRYGVIPFVPIKNLSITGKNDGVGDLDDIIPLNVEYNRKQSDVSEIIDYHASPITVVYGAKVGNLEKGANKVWGGLPKDAKVENLELKGDTSITQNYIDNLKLAMCEIGGIPETVLGGAQAISNTSGVALQYINLPLIEKTRMKRQATESGFEKINKMIILVASLEGLISKPDGVPNRDFFHTECKIPETLPKDTLVELQQIQMEMTMGIEDRHGAMERMGKENIEELIKRIDSDREAHPEIYGGLDKKIMSENGNPKINSGMNNGTSVAEQIRTAVNGKNGND